MPSDSNHPFFRSPEGGGVSVSIIDQLVRLYELTRDQKLHEFVSRVARHFPLIARMRSTGQAPLMHPYIFMGYLGGIVDMAAVEDRQEDFQWVERVWEDLAGRHLYPTGSLGYNELLSESAPNDTPVENGQPARHHQETCATVEWLFLNARLHQATGGVRYVQAMEDTIYNALLAAQSSDGMQWMYFTPLRYEKRWFTGPTSCCYFSGPRGVARLPQWVYSLDREGIRLNLYESSDATLKFEGHSVALEQSCPYPGCDEVSLRIHPDVPFSFALRLRIPRWATAIRITLNGHAIAAEPGPDGYCRIQRKWSVGDQVMLGFDVPAEVHCFLNDHYGVIRRGPEVLAVDQRDNASLDLDRVVLQEGKALESTEPADGRRRYRGEAQAGGQSVSVLFTPYADCGGEGARFRTAFPLEPST